MGVTVQAEKNEKLTADTNQFRTEISTISRKHSSTGEGNEDVKDKPSA